MVTSDASACVKIIDTHNWRVRNNANKRIGVNVVPFTNAQGVAFPANVNIPWKNYTCSSSGSTAANRPINSAGVSDGSTNALGGAHTVARAGGRACCPLSNPMLQPACKAAQNSSKRFKHCTRFEYNKTITNA